MAEEATPTPEEAEGAAAPASEAEQAAEDAESLLGGDETPEGEAEASEEAKGEEGEDAKAEKSDAKGDDEKADAAPDEYEPFDVPEGMERDEEGLKEFADVARELDLPQAKAQKLVDLSNRITQRNMDAAYQVWADKQNEWAGEVRNDKDLGGSNFEQSKANAKAFVLQYGGQEALDALKITGAGNHPAVFRVLARAGKEMADDSIVGGQQGGKPEVSRAKAMFPSMN